jgi:ketosteroid isomerase-like protein
VTERIVAERMIHELHGARVRGDLSGMCRLFAQDGRFEIVGASADKPISIRATSLAAFQPWLAMMVKVFRLSDYGLLSVIVEWPRAAVHWRADIHSKVTGVTVPTELVDLVEIRDERFIIYSEFFVPRI